MCAGHVRWPALRGCLAMGPKGLACVIPHARAQLQGVGRRLFAAPGTALFGRHPHTLVVGHAVVVCGFGPTSRLWIRVARSGPPRGCGSVCAQTGKQTAARQRQTPIAKTRNLDVFGSRPTLAGSLGQMAWSQKGLAKVQPTYRNSLFRLPKWLP